MPLSRHDYTVGCICPMGMELAPVKAMLDHTHPSLPTQRDQNSYTLGEMEGHNIVIAVLPEIGTNSAATVAIQLLNDFPSIRFGLLVGTGGGVPGEEDDGPDIRLGDVAISKPTASFGGVVQYDLGKSSTTSSFERTGVLARPPQILRSSVETLAADHRTKGSRAPQYLSDMLQRFPAMEEEYSHPGSQQDQLFRADYPHPSGPNCRHCDKRQIIERDDRPDENPKFHYGTIGSANTVVKDAGLREELRRELKIISVEMEAAGLMDSFPCLVIRGICDYADSHKNKKWQPYAAATAAAYMKELLSVIPLKDVAKVSPAAAVVHFPKYNRGLNLLDAPDMANHLFIGRDDELQRIETVLLSDLDSSDRKVLVLGGMGGIGKTQLAVRYAKKHHTSYTSVFWINATSESRLRTSLRRLAPQILLRVTGEGLDDDELWAQISLWLSEQENSRWLLIFDNYDEPDQYEIEKYYPSVAHGTIIITTRQLDRVNGYPVKVQSIARYEDSLNILATWSGRPDALLDSGARQLAQRLDGLPMALATVGTFLKQSSVSFSKYLQQYEARWQVTPGPGPELLDYPTRTLYTAWNLSVVQIEQEMPQAAKLLAFLAYLDHQDIWYDLLRVDPNTNQPQWFIDIAGDEFLFEQAMTTLARYCLVESHYQIGSYSLHTCVHDWTLNGLNCEVDVDQYWLAFKCVADHIQIDSWDYLSGSRDRRITPHALRLCHERFERAGRQQVWLENELPRVEDIGRLLYQQNQHQAAERILLRALHEREKVLGLGHTSTVSTVNILGLLYADQGKLAKAEEMYRRALQGKEKALGPEHTSTLNTVNNLAILCASQGKMAESEEMYQRALQGKEKALGPEHTSTLETLNNLATLYANRGKLAEAEQMYLRALQGFEKGLGLEHTSTLDMVNNLGVLYKNQGKLAEAEEMYRRALQGNEKALGPEHTSTLDTVNTLGTLYADQGKMAEAEEMFQRALQGKEKVLGPEHTSTLDTVNNLATLYADQGKMAEAEEMYRRALQGKEKVLGPEHTSTLDTVNNLGILCASQGKLAEAEKMYRRALQGKEKVLGPEHTSTLNTVNNLGTLYANRGKLAEAEEMYLRALQGFEKGLGLEHTSTLDIVNNLATLYADRGKLAKAEEMYLRALQGKEKVLGPEHTSTLNTVNTLGILYADQGKMAKAEEMYRRALQGKEKALGLEHTSTLDTVNNLSIIYANQGKMAEAEEMYRRALQGFEKGLGPEHTSTLDTVNNLGVLYKNQGKLAEAETMYRRALQGKEKALGPEHTSTLNTVNNLGTLYASQGKMAEAEEMFQRALQGKEKALGLEHTSTLDTVNNLGLLYADRGKMAEAEEMYRRALQGKEKVLGPEHTSTLDTVNNLATLYADQGKLAEAEEMFQRAGQGYEKALGPKLAITHIPALNIAENLANLYMSLGRTDEAMEMYSYALHGFESVLGSSNRRCKKIVAALEALK